MIEIGIETVKNTVTDIPAITTDITVDDLIPVPILNEDLDTVIMIMNTLDLVKTVTIDVLVVVVLIKETIKSGNRRREIRRLDWL